MVKLSSADKVLVTGAGGFIGSHLTEALVRTGADVCALTQYNSRNDWGNLEDLSPDVLRSVRVVSGDVRDADFVRCLMRGRTLVFHLAALIAIPYSYSALASYVSTNVQGTLNVLQAARDFSVERVIHTSTSEVYGTAQYAPIDEEHPLQGQSPYSASKIAADKMAESFHASFQLPVVTVRPFNAFGPRQSARAVIPAISTQAITGQRVRLGSLAPVRDFTFVADTVDGFLLASRAEAAVGQVINLGSGKGITIGELAKKIFGLLGTEPLIEEAEERLRPEASEVMRLIASSARAKELLGWTPQVSLEDGLARTLDWLRSHIKRYKADIYNL
jgi:NAD dependent epimerase/dehydratase